MHPVCGLPHRPLTRSRRRSTRGAARSSSSSATGAQSSRSTSRGVPGARVRTAHPGAPARDGRRRARRARGRARPEATRAPRLERRRAARPRRRPRSAWPRRSTATGAPRSSLATCIVDDPTGLRARPARRDGAGRRDPRAPRSPDRRGARVREINAGLYAATVALFARGARVARPEQRAGELYLTDIVAFAATRASASPTVTLGGDVLAGVNDREQLAEVEQTMHARIVRDVAPRGRHGARRRAHRRRRDPRAGRHRRERRGPPRHDARRRGAPHRRRLRA